MDPPLKVTPHFASKEDALAGWLDGLPDGGKLLSSLSRSVVQQLIGVCVLCRLSLADAMVGGGVDICKPLRELAARFARDWVDASSGGGAKCRPDDFVVLPQRRLPLSIWISYRRSRHCDCTPGTAPTSSGLPPKPCPPKPYPDEPCATAVRVLTPVSLLTITQQSHNHDAAPFGFRRELCSPLPLRAGTRASGSGMGTSLGGIGSRWCANTLS